MKRARLLFIAVLLTALIPVFLSTVVFSEITDGLLTHLKLDNSARDSAGSHHAVLSDDPVFVEGKIGSHSLRFDGSNDTAVLEQSGDLDFGPTSDFSVSLWIKTNGWTSDPPIITNKAWKSGKNPGWGLFASGGGKWKANAANGEKRVDTVGGIITDGEWHHLAVTFDNGARAVLYQDGERIGTMNLSEIGGLDTDLPVVIAQDGTRKYPHFFPGTLDDVSLWNRTLNGREIWDIYVTGSTGLEFTVPQSVKTTIPTPANYSENIHTVCTLRWREAKDAVTHDVYLDVDYGEVNQGDKTSPAFQTNTGRFSYSTPRLKMGSTYFWRIDAVSSDGTVTRGDVWEFRTKRDAVAHWRFDPSPDGAPIVQDLRNSRNGGIEGTLRFKQNPNALVFDGKTTEVEIMDVLAAPMFRNPEITAETWVFIDRKDSEKQQGGIVVSSYGESQGWRLIYDDYAFNFGVSHNGVFKQVRSKTYFMTERWYHVTATYDGVTLKMYVNGQLENKTVFPAAADYRVPPANRIGVYRDAGQDVRFSGRIHEIRLFDRTLSFDEIQASYEAKQERFPGPAEVAFGPYLQFTSPDSAVIRWKTEDAQQTIFEYGERSSSEIQRNNSTPKTEHEIVLTELKPQKKYFFTIKTIQGGETVFTPRYECDNFFNYSLPAKPKSDSAEASAPLGAFILRTSKIDRGYCLVVGCGDGMLIDQLARRSNLYVHAVDTDPDRVAQTRSSLMKSKLYGVRATVQHVESYERLPFTNFFANLIVADRPVAETMNADTAKELYRILRPNGGMAFLGTDPQKLDWLDTSVEQFRLATHVDGPWSIFTRLPLEGVGEWTHQYGNPDNSSNGGETLLGATGTGDLEVQWIGRPGSRAMVDRNPRKPAPLSVNGRLFTQGLNRIIAQDAYNGTILWSMENPVMQRYNMPRDCGNWCADPDYLYAAIKGQCWKIDALKGTIASVFDVNRPLAFEKEQPFDWGYIARYGHKLYGSAVKAGTYYSNFRGGSTTGWADAMSGPITFKVCSDSFFALDPNSGETAWTYSNGVLINPTITIADGRVFFVECRNDKVKQSIPRRVGIPELWDDQYLVALNAETGVVEWEKPIDTEDGIIVFYLLYTHNTLLIAASNTQYHLYAYDASNGERKWNVSHKWINNNHGQHMQHPAIVGDKIFLRPRGYNVSDGSFVTANMPPHEGGCATFAATSSALIYRGKESAISLWDVDKEEVSNWFSLRPGCWLSTIPANGMVLSPEGGGGCSCGGWLETSVGFILSQNSRKER